MCYNTLVYKDWRVFSMKTYKVVPFAGTIVINKKDCVQDQIVKYFDVINQECVDGWEFVALAPVNVTVKEGGLKTKGENYNAFIFAKEVKTEA